MKTLSKLVINALALYIVSFLTPGFTFFNFESLAIAAIVLAIVNTYIKPIVQILFLPISVVTIGITAFLINVMFLWGVSLLVPGFEIQNFTTAVIGSLFLALTTVFLTKIIRD